jgi:hypothetical protein
MLGQVSPCPASAGLFFASAVVDPSACLRELPDSRLFLRTRLAASFQAVSIAVCEWL